MTRRERKEVHMTGAAIIVAFMVILWTMHMNGCKDDPIYEPTLDQQDLAEEAKQR